MTNEPVNVLTQLSDQLATLVAGAAPRVVQIGGRHGRPASGTVFAPERVITAAHAVERRRDLVVVDGGGTARAAELVGIDEGSGLAVLGVAGLDVSPFESAGQARVGQFVVALGRTLSGALAASAGIGAVIGGPLRTTRHASLELVLRADVRVHPLGAGGPLIDAGGRALGVATGAVIRGLPLFVPASVAWPIVESIRAHGSTRRGYLGISAQPVRVPERQRGGRPQEVGLLVVGVAAASPAEEAGVLIGDILVAFDGQAVDDHDALLALLAGDRVGKSLPLETLRGGESRTLTVTVGAR